MLGISVRARATVAAASAGPRVPSRPGGGLRAGASPPFSTPTSPRHPRERRVQSNTAAEAAMQYSRQEDGCDRAGKGAGCRGCEGELGASGLEGAQGSEGERYAQSEGELAVGEEGDDAGGEPEGCPAGGLAPAVAHETIEEVGGSDNRCHPHRLRTQNRGQRREEDAVGEGVVAAVPTAVPDPQADALEQLGAENLGGEVADLRVPSEHQRGQRGAERHSREPFGSECL